MKIQQKHLIFIYFQENFLLKLEPSEITSFFYNNFFRFWEGVEPPYPSLRTPLSQSSPVRLFHYSEAPAEPWVSQGQAIKPFLLSYFERNNIIQLYIQGFSGWRRSLIKEVQLNLRKIKLFIRTSRLGTNHIPS